MLEAGQNAVVTGAGSGIGRAVAVALARRGVRVLAVGRDRAKLDGVLEQCAGQADLLTADVASETGRATIAKAARDPLHALIHAAGAWMRAPLRDMSPDRWCALDAINLQGPVLLTTACLNKLQTTDATVVFVNSTAALAGVPGVAAYAAGKAALRMAVDVLRQELSGQGVRVLTVFPGRTDTPMQEAVLAAEGRTAPPGTLMQPEDVAAMVLAALTLPARAEVTDIVMRPSRKM